MGQFSFEDVKLGHGVFTYYLLAALNGKATPDGRGYITLGAVSDHVARSVNEWVLRNKVGSAAESAQKPWFKGPNDARDMPLAVSKAFLEGQREAAALAAQHEAVALLAQRELLLRKKAAKERLADAYRAQNDLLGARLLVEIEGGLETLTGQSLEVLLSQVDELQNPTVTRVSNFVLWWKSVRSATSRIAPSSPDPAVVALPETTTQLPPVVAPPTPAVVASTPTATPPPPSVTGPTPAAVAPTPVSVPSLPAVAPPTPAVVVSTPTVTPPRPPVTAPTSAVVVPTPVSIPAPPAVTPPPPAVVPSALAVVNSGATARPADVNVRPSGVTVAPPPPAPAATSPAVTTIPGATMQLALRKPAPDPEIAPPTSRPPPPVPAPRDRQFQNSLGMRFVLVPRTEVWFSVWETRVKDFQEFSASNPSVGSAWRNPFFKKEPVTPGPNHPVVNVTHRQAKEFCKWLTDKERLEGVIAAPALYRLPTDEEWSWAVGIGDKEEKGTPAEKSGRLKSVFPWGTQWPPPNGTGNYTDSDAKAKFGTGLFGALTGVIAGYTDGYPTTAPVGSFPPNALGIFDLGGNVSEWCEEWPAGRMTFRVCRGGSWMSNYPMYINASSRFNFPKDLDSDDIGFRVVLQGLAH